MPATRPRLLSPLYAYHLDGSPDVPPPKAGKKNPHVDTSFLPDRERERGMLEQREKLKKEWMEEQEKIKSEPLATLVSVVFPLPNGYFLELETIWAMNGRKRLQTVNRITDDRIDCCFWLFFWLYLKIICNQFYLKIVCKILYNQLYLKILCKIICNHFY